MHPGEVSGVRWAHLVPSGFSSSRKCCSWQSSEISLARRRAGRPVVSAEAVDQLTAGGHVLAAAAWLQHGSPDLAAASALTALGCHQRTTRGEDACLAYAQLATLAFQRQGYK